MGDPVLVDAAFLVDVTRRALYLLILLSAPALATSLVVGFLSATFQATTSIQDQVLSFVPKAIAVFVTLALVGEMMGAQIVNFSRGIFEGLSLIR